MQQRGSASADVLSGTFDPSVGTPAQRATSAVRRARSTYVAQHRAAAALYWVAALVRASARGLSGAARRLDAWLERRRVAAAALRDFRTMSERDLLDIGLTRVDVHRVAWGAAHR